MIFFRYEMFVHEDALRYAIGIKQLAEHSIDSPAALFNFRMSFAYYMLTNYIYKSLGLSPLVIFHTISSLSTVVFAYALYKFSLKLTDSSPVAVLCSMLSVLSPSIWFISRNGHPLILANSIAFLALWFFASLLKKDKITPLQWVFLSLLLTLSISFRLDLMLIWGVFPAVIYFYHGIRKKFYFVGTLTAMAVALVLNYFWYRYLIQNWSDSAETLLNLQSRLPSISYILSLLKNALIRNTSLWALGTGLINILLAVVSFFFFTNSRYRILLLAASLPYLVFLLFWGGDTSRYIIPSIAFFSLLSSKLIYENLRLALWKKQVVSVLLCVAVFFGGAINFPLVSQLYNFKKNIAGYPISCVPIDNYLRDYEKRKAFFRKMDETAKKVASYDNDNVLIIQLTGSMYHIYYLETMHRLNSEKGCRLDGVTFREYSTPENKFIVFEPEYNFDIETPISRLIENNSLKIEKIHITPGSSELSGISSETFLNSEEVEQLLGYEKTMHASRTRLR